MLNLDDEDEENSVSSTWIVDITGTLRNKKTDMKVSNDGVVIQGTEFRLSLKDIELESAVLGTGACGVVTRGKIRKTGDAVAIKNLQVDDPKKKEVLLSEIKGLLASQGCPYLVQCYGGFPHRNSHCVAVVLEFMDRGNLRELLKGHADGVPQEHLPCISFQMIKAVNHLHSNKCLHRDIKPENILHNAAGQVKLTDFGISRDLAVSSAICTFVGTHSYMAPERCSSETYSFLSDTWSIGMVIYELATGLNPFRDISTFIGLFEAITDKPEPRLDESRFAPELCDVVSKCLSRDVKVRFNTEQLLEVEICRKGHGSDAQEAFREFLTA